MTTRAEKRAAVEPDDLRTWHMTQTCVDGGHDGCRRGSGRDRWCLCECHPDDDQVTVNPFTIERKRDDS